MKKHIIAVFLLVGAMLLCLPGCAAVPDDVQNEINSYESIEQGGEKHGMELVDISEIIGKSDTTPQSVKQLLMNDVTVDYPDKGAQAMSFELNYRQCDAKAEVERIAAEQFPGLDINAGGEDNDAARLFIRESGTAYSDSRNVISVYALNGATTIFHGETFEYYDYLGSEAYSQLGAAAISGWHPYDYFPAARIISLHSGERIEEGLSYTLPAGEVKLTDAMATAQSYLDSVMAGLEDNEFTYRIRKIYVRRIADGLYGYEFSAERLYNGFPIDSTVLYAPEADMGAEGYFVEGGDPIYVWMIAPDKVDYFQCAARRQVANAAPAYDSILSLESALSMISETLTDSAAFVVNSVELLYINGYYGEEALTMYDYEETVAYAKHPRDTRLVWALLLDDPHATLGTLDSPHDPHHSLFVDVLTGELIGFCESVYSY